MAGRALPGHPGVTVYPAGEVPAGSYVVKNPDGSIFQDAEGNTYAGRETGALMKALPYIVGGVIAAPYAAAALGGLGGVGGGAAATAAPAAGTAAATAGGVSSWLAPALKYGLPVATGLAGSIIQAKGNESAAKEQARLTEEALADARAQRDIENARYTDETAYNRQQTADTTAYNRNRYADFSQSLEPYRRNGITASERLAALLKQRNG